MDPANKKTNSSDAGQLRGSVLLFAGRLFSIGVNFGVQVLTVRYLVKSEYGILAFATSVAAVAAIFCVMGMDKTVSRFLPRYLQEEKYSKFLGATLILVTAVPCVALFATLLLILTSQWLVPGAESVPGGTVMGIIAGLIFVEAANALMTSFFAVLENPFSILLRRHILGPLLKLIAVGVVWGLQGGLVAFAIGQLVAGLIATSVCIPLFINTLRAHPVWKARHEAFQYPVGELFSYGLGRLVGDAAFVLRNTMIPVLIGVYYANTVVADYQVVFPLARLSEVVLVTFSIMLFPQASRIAGEHDPSLLKRLYERNSDWITLLTFPAFAVLFLTSRFLPQMLFGSEYGSSGMILQCLAVGFFINAAFGTSLRILRAIESNRRLMIADLILIGLSAGLALASIAIWGAIGAAMAVAGCYALQAMISVSMLHATGRVPCLMLRNFTPFALGMVLCMGADWVTRLFSSVQLAGCLAVLIVVLIQYLVFRSRLELREVFPELFSRLSRRNSNDALAASDTGVASPGSPDHSLKCTPEPDRRGAV